MTVTEEMIDTPRSRFAVRRHGTADAPLIVALHGFPDIAATFDALGAAAAARGYQLVAPQMRGYAPSTLEVPSGRVLFDTLAQDAIAVADALAPGRRFAMVGHDNGAFATYSVLRLAGERVVAAVTLTAAHPAAVFVNSGRMPAQLWRSRYAMLFQVPGVSDWWASRGDFGYLRRLWRRWAAPGWTPPAAHLDAVIATMQRSWPAPLLHYRAIPFAGDETPLAQPLLYLIGAEDGCVLPAAGARQERYFTGPFRSEVVPGCGHFLHLERPEIVLPRILNWVDEQWPGR